MTSIPPVLPAQIDAFVQMIATRPRTDRVTENSEFLAMLWRMVRAAEYRTIEDPEMLTQIAAIAQRLAEVVNVAIAVNAARYAQDPHRAASAAECGRAMGISKQSAGERRALGLASILKRLGAAESASGVVRFSEAKREREARTAAAEYATAVFTDFRSRRIA